MVLVINAGVLMAVVLISKTKFLHGVYKFLARKELILNITFILVMFIYGYCMYRIKYSNKIQSDLYVIIVTFASIIACILLRWKAMERETEYQQEQIKLTNRYSEEYNALVEISRKKQHVSKIRLMHYMFVRYKSRKGTKKIYRQIVRQKIKLSKYCIL